MILTYQINASSLSGSSGSVTNTDSTCSSLITIFPKAFITGTNINCFFNNGIGSTNTNTTYAPVSSSMSAYVANGRPYWSSGITNDVNICAVFPPSLTNTGTTASLILNFPAINWGGTQPTGNYSMSFELINAGAYAQSDISTTNFTLNF
jgi:hypothetical protein